MSPRNASRLTLLFFLLWWGPTTATGRFLMPVTVEGEGTTAAVPAATNNAEHYSRSCDATIGLKDEKHNILNILDLDDVDSVKAHYAYYRWTVIVHLQ